VSLAKAAVLQLEREALAVFRCRSDWRHFNRSDRSAAHLSPYKSPVFYVSHVILNAEFGKPGVLKELLKMDCHEKQWVF
jgi:hypothetical protein